jgi:RNA polymerase sigma-70 factor (ECF subfamily)
MGKRLRSAAVRGEPVVENDVQMTRSNRWTLLLLQARRGNKLAFDTLMQEAERSIWLYAMQMVGDPALADDVTTETFEKVWLNLSSYDEELSNARTWIYLIARRLSLDYLDRRRRQRHLEAASLEAPGFGDEDEGAGGFEPEDQAEAAPPEGADRSFFARLVEEALNRLEQSDRDVLRLCHIEEKSYEEIAVLLGCSIKAVGPRLTRARERFRQALDSDAQP